MKSILVRLVQASVAPFWLVASAVSLAQTIPVHTVAANAGQSGFELEGVVQPVHQATVAAQTQGRVLSIKVKAGDKVKAGQLLATLDDRETQVGAERSNAQMAQAQAEYRNARTQWERTRDLQQKGFVSAAALDTATTQMQAAQAARDQAAASIKLSGIAQGYTKVTAPFDGWVLQTHTQAGDLAFPGAPVATVYAPQPLRAVVQVPNTRASDAKAASTVTIVASDASNPRGSQAIAVTARQIVPSADPVSQTTEWRWDLAAKDATGLLPGQPLRIQFDGSSSTTTTRILIPTQAVVRRGELTAVYVAQGKVFALRAVRTGASQSGTVEVIAGLRSGEVIALDPVKAAAAR